MAGNIFWQEIFFGGNKNLAGKMFFGGKTILTGNKILAGKTIDLDSALSSSLWNFLTLMMLELEMASCVHSGSL